MKRIVFGAVVVSLVAHIALAEGMETASEAVRNMKIGWNLGNSLDSNSGDTLNMWIEWWTDGSVTSYETAWGQPVTRRELIEMFRDAGFGAIRVPVTWYPHIGPDGAVNEEWMKRVHEVVDYVIEAGLYCIVDVHHDTGAANTHWLVAEGDTYEKSRERYENLWTNIANEFKDYDEHLLFEAYNEMLDVYDSWCFASFYSPSSYDESVAKDAYGAINDYAQTFVNAVRATGGNNAERNLVVSTYGACSGEGTWSSHLNEPLTELKYPEDAVDGHIVFEVHSYPSLESTASATMDRVNQMLSAIGSYLQTRAPVIIGEFGVLDESDYDTNHDVMLEVMKQLVANAKERDIACFYWMMLSDGSDRSVPQWTREDLAEAILKGYYGEDYEMGIEDVRSRMLQVKDDAVYDLAGRRVTSVKKGGVYIKSGRKFVK